MPAKATITQDPTESLIAESHILRLDLDVQNECKLQPLLSAAEHWHDALIAICDAPKDTVIRFHGRDHIFIWPPKMRLKHGTQILSWGTGDDDYSLFAQIVLAPKDKQNQWIRVTYRLYRNAVEKDGAPMYFLECSGNPTTVLAGNNVLPVTTADRKTGAIESLPSSSRLTMLTVNRVLIELLAKLNQELNPGSADDYFDFRKSAGVKRGDYDLVRAQFCCYLPTANVQIFLQLLTILYAPFVVEDDVVIDVAEQLGLKVKHFKDKKGRITGIQFQWHHGKKLVTSLVFYDKRKRVAQMRQGKTLSPEEIGLVHENVRFDITLHKRGIEQLIGAARKKLAKDRISAPAFLDDLPANEFLQGKLKPKMWWFEKAVAVLSTSPSEGKPGRKSFADWLVSVALGDMLRLTSIVKCTPAALHAFSQLAEPVVKAWLLADKFEAGSWAKQIIEISKLEKTAVYEHRKRLLKAHGIDIAIPYPFYRDMLHHGPKSLTTQQNREAMNNALGKNTAQARVKTAAMEEVWRLAQEGITNFFAQLVDVVGATVSSNPTHLPLKVVGKIADLPAGAMTAEQVDTTRAPKKAAGVASAKADSPPRRRKVQTPLLPPGIDRRSSFETLFNARRIVRKQLKQDLTDDERDHLEQRHEELRDLVFRRRAMIAQQKMTRAGNKAAARLKRMGGPISRLPVKGPADPSKPPSASSKK